MRSLSWRSASGSRPHAGAKVLSLGELTEEQGYCILTGVKTAPGVSLEHSEAGKKTGTKQAGNRAASRGKGKGPLKCQL